MGHSAVWIADKGHRLYRRLIIIMTDTHTLTERKRGVSTFSISSTMQGQPRTETERGQNERQQQRHSCDWHSYQCYILCIVCAAQFHVFGSNHYIFIYNAYERWDVLGVKCIRPNLVHQAGMLSVSWLTLDQTESKDLPISVVKKGLFWDGLLVLQSQWIVKM